MAWYSTAVCTEKAAPLGKQTAPVQTGDFLVKPLTTNNRLDTQHDGGRSYRWCSLVMFSSDHFRNFRQRSCCCCCNNRCHRVVFRSRTHLCVIQHPQLIQSFLRGHSTALMVVHYLPFFKKTSKCSAWSTPVLFELVSYRQGDAARSCEPFLQN